MANLADHVRAYLSCPPERDGRSFLDFLRARDPGLLSHHPPGEPFQSHVWRVGGFLVCKGCLMAWCGSGFALVLHPLLILALGNWWVQKCAIWQVASGMAVLLLPTVLTAFWKKVHAVKHAARFLLGFLVVSAMVYALALPWDAREGWLARGVMLAVYLLVRIPLERRRHAENARLGKAR